MIADAAFAAEIHGGSPAGVRIAELQEDAVSGEDGIEWLVSTAEEPITSATFQLHRIEEPLKPFALSDFDDPPPGALGKKEGYVGIDSAIWSPRSWLSASSLLCDTNMCSIVSIDFETTRTRPSRCRCAGAASFRTDGNRHAARLVRLVQPVAGD